MKPFFAAILFVSLSSFMAKAQPKPTEGSYELYLTQIAAAEAFLQLNKISEAKKYLYRTDESLRGLEWHFLNKFLDQSEKQITGEGVKAFADIKVSPNGQYMAVAASDGIIRLYRLPDLSVTLEFKGHESTVSSLDFSPDGQFLASGGRDHKVILWSLKTGQQVFVNTTDFSQGIYQVRFSPGGNLLGVVSWELTGNNPPVMGFAKLLNVATGELIRKIETEPHPAAGLVFTKNGSEMIVSCWGEMAIAYKVDSGEKLWAYDLSDPAEYNAFHSNALSPDGHTLMLGSADHRIHMLNATTGELLRKIESSEGHTKTVKAISYSPNGSWAASAGEDQSILVWNTSDMSRKIRLIGHAGTVNALAWSKDNALLYSAASDGTLKVWNIEKPFGHSFEVCDYGPWQLTATPDARWFGAPCSNTLGIYSVESGGQIHDFKDRSGLAASMDAKGQRWATASFDGVVRVWDVEEGKEIKTYEGHTSRVDGVLYLNKANAVASVGDTTLRIRFLVNDRELVIPIGKGAFRVIANPTESQAFVSFSDGRVVVFNTANWQIDYTLNTEASINEMAISPDGNFLALFGSKGAQLWNLPQKSMKYHFTDHEQTGYGLDFSPDGRYLITGSYDQTFRLWDLTTGQCSLTFHGYQETVYSTRFLGSYKLLVGSSQGQMYYYDFTPSK
ncbi:hypothetical protein [Roseivirga sp. UBA1976]|uniref:WD40 repeat domain-containing protein n=1 Tax=Roseivirga sp. UBA1976 TaxID=1947386 RepID=UPI00257A4BEA|nr:hypothetical protein [Roseivirga sp. UBA1976]